MTPNQAARLSHERASGYGDGAINHRDQASGATTVPLTGSAVVHRHTTTASTVIMAFPQHRIPCNNTGMQASSECLPIPTYEQVPIADRVLMEILVEKALFMWLWVIRGDKEAILGDLQDYLLGRKPTTVHPHLIERYIKRCLSVGIPVYGK